VKPNFIEVDRETPYLLPPSVQDWLPTGHLARFTAADRARINTTGYSTLNAAYTAASTSGVTTILTLNALLNESLTVNKILKIIGGYDKIFTTRTNQPTELQGLLTIGTGSLIVDGLAVR